MPEVLILLGVAFAAYAGGFLSGYDRGYTDGCTDVWRRMFEQCEDKWRKHDGSAT